MKSNAYALCPCGSGKKIKFCCGTKNVENSSFKKQDFFLKFITENSSKKLLQIVSLLQLIPENATKVIRLEEITHLIISNYNQIDNVVDCKAFSNILEIYFENDYREDPSESCFSEVILFKNGNNIVFPGICNNSTETNQILIEALFKVDNSVSELCLNEIQNGLLLNLSIHNQIAIKLGISRYEYVEDYKEKIKFFDLNSDNDKLELFFFTEEDISDYCSRLRIPNDTINQFTIELGNFPKITDYEESILLKKPFLKINNNYILVLPSAQMYSINCFINEKIIIHEQQNILENIFENHIKRKSIFLFLGMGWKSLDSTSDSSQKISLWQFDNDKIAIVDYNVGKKENIDNEIEILNALNQRLGFKIIYITITSNYSIEKPSISYQKPLDFIDFQLIVSFYDLERLMILYNLNELSLWKYLNAQERAISKGFQSAPFFSILSYYSWYDKNSNSFFESDNEPLQMLVFGFEVQGNKVIEAQQKNDRHLVLDRVDDNWIHSPVTKTRKLFPIYTSDRIFNGFLEQVLEKYLVNIWVKSERSDIYGSSFTDCILYWLNEFFPTLNPFINTKILYPIIFVIDFEQDFFDLSEEDIEENREIDISQINLESTVNYEYNIIKIFIPKKLFFLLHQNNNLGEIVLMRKILYELGKSLSNNQIFISLEDIELILMRHMPVGMAKMIVTGTSIHNISKDNRYIGKPSKLDKADTSIVLEDLVKWMNIHIEEDIRNEVDKINTCRNGIDTIISKIRTEIENYNSIDLIKCLMERHESIIHSNSFYRVRLVTFQECYGKYEDVFKDFMDEDSLIMRTALSLRTLIEFAAAEVYYGEKAICNSDLDFLVALMDHLLFLGATIDLIESKIGNPKMGLLPSGRLGVSKESFEKMNKFSLEFKKDELIEYSENYKNPATGNIFSEEYINEVDRIFKDDFGIEFNLVTNLLDLLAHICIEEYKTSCLALFKDEFIDLLKKETNLSGLEIDCFFRHFALESRGNMGKPPVGYKHSDIFPWRYNRKLSYLLRPILLIKNAENKEVVIFSARHLSSASENLNYLLFNGLLKVDSQYKKINSLLASRNNVKGKEFRNEVANWLSENFNLEVIPYEYKIPRKKQHKDYGDIDVLAFDNTRKIIYCIECKNTKQTKIIYEFSVSIQNYIEKQLPKHLNRVMWVKDNKSVLSERFNSDFSNYEVRSLLVSSFQLPLKLLENISGVEIYSLNELKRKKNIF